MIWADYLTSYKNFLKLEKSLSANTVEAYMADIQKFIDFTQTEGPLTVTCDDIRLFCDDLNEGQNMSIHSQARILSGIKSFFKYLLVHDIIDHDPSEMVLGPRMGRKLPTVLSPDEIDQLINAIDLGSETGYRNRAILETLYGCGLRVSELINLKLTDLHFTESYVKIKGKGSKERLVPMGRGMKDAITLYIYNYRDTLNIGKKDENTLFLNHYGRKLTRVMIFTIIKDLAAKIGLKKTISPHTFRHSFATQLIDAGADLKAIQEMLGHESITTTEIYTHLDREYLRDTIMRFHPRS
ncbi:MAG: tyrosine recombinase XerD [Salinivirgaceae bacterium]|nr:tyrosine recombinase XerD [Salinivirgaceae bacterium]MBR4620080.1 tyrosine recombinase XerD [Salinivirgaceae bacterium]